MTLMTRLPVLALLAALPALPAAALTPEELWARWQAQAEGWGLSLTATATPAEGGALALTDLALGRGGATQGLPPGSPVQAVTLRPIEGGAVAVDLGLPGALDLPTGDPALGDLRIEAPGLALTARDDGPRVRYELAAPRLRAAALGQPDDVGADAFAVEVAGLALSLADGPDAEGAVDLSLAADGYAYLASSGAATGLASTQSARSEGRMEVAARLTLPPMATLMSIQDGPGFVRALDEGLALRVEVASEPASQAAWFQGFPFDYSYESRGGASRGLLEAGRSGVALTGAYEGGTATLSLPSLGATMGLGLPVGPIEGAEIAFGGGEAAFRVPFGPGLGEFQYRVALGEVTVGEPAWAAVDPEGRLPRAPFRLEVDVGGRATIDVAALAEAAAAAEAGGMAELGPPPIPTIESLDVRAFALSALGVDVTGSGAFTFSGPPDEPVPAGTATARVEGLDRLLDALVALGWITAQDARDARLGLAVAFRAGDGPDVRVMDLEARADGAILLNGVQVQ